MKIDINKKYTSNGKPIRILCTDRNHIDYPVLGIGEDGTVYFFTKDGKSTYQEAYDLVEVWEPQKGDWCLFWDTNDHDGAVLSRIDKVLSDGRFKSLSGTNWKNCQKFDGTLPEHLKGL
jgi:hypothetical protein